MMCFKDYFRSRKINYTPEQLETLVDSLQARNFGKSATTNPFFIVSISQKIHPFTQHLGANKWNRKSTL
jgi:hypothetical protein